MDSVSPSQIHQNLSLSSSSLGEQNCAQRHAAMKAADARPRQQHMREREVTGTPTAEWTEEEDRGYRMGTYRVGGGEVQETRVQETRVQETRVQETRVQKMRTQETRAQETRAQQHRRRDGQRRWMRRTRKRARRAACGC